MDTPTNSESVLYDNKESSVDNNNTPNCQEKHELTNVDQMKSFQATNNADDASDNRTVYQELNGLCRKQVLVGTAPAVSAVNGEVKCIQTDEGETKLEQDEPEPCYPCCSIFGPVDETKSSCLSKTCKNWMNLRLKVKKIVDHKFFENSILVLILASSTVLVSFSFY